jgi:hypothetical protein
MATLDNRLVTWNPWWSDPAAMGRDPHLRESEAAPVQCNPPLLEGLPVTLGDAHTVRGPVRRARPP